MMTKYKIIVRMKVVNIELPPDLFFCAPEIKFRKKRCVEYSFSHTEENIHIKYTRIPRFFQQKKRKEYLAMERIFRYNIMKQMSGFDTFCESETEGEWCER